MAGGYMGKILLVDLTEGKLAIESPDEKLCRDYIGGYGVGARVLFDRQKAGVDPLGPDNIFGILTGPLDGTQALSGTKFTVVGKSPLTGGWGDSNSGGYFGAFMKFAGFDAVFFNGISEKPVYLLLDNGKGELRDASFLWGKDSRDTEKILQSEFGREAEVLCIGPAGEKLSLISAVISKNRAAARSGLGAVMGSKKLKAVVTRGKMKVPVADAAKTSELRKKYLGLLGGHIAWLKPVGTPFLTSIGIQTGDSPVKNWSGVASIDFPKSDSIAAEPLIANRTRKFACYQCPIGCGGYQKEGKGEYQWEADTRTPEYETLAMFGTNMLNNNLDSIVKASDLCDRYGVDTISAASTIAFAMECYEKGIITKNDTEGIELTWGNHRAIVAMTEKLVKREGFGDILADGTKKAAEKIGKGSEKFAIHINGEELPAHNPKHNLFYALSYILDATPGRHFVGSELSDGPNHPGGLLPAFDMKTFSGRGEARRIGSSFHQVVTCSGMCLFIYWAFPTIDPVIEFIQSVTGWDATREELLMTGERIINIRHAFNLREGLNPLKYKVPDRVFNVLPGEAGQAAGVNVDLKTMADEYLTSMDWDKNTSFPSKKKLADLSLKDVARVLYP
jgi:aldehyde:ferredoxin oxidoreductase